MLEFKVNNELTTMSNDDVAQWRSWSMEYGKPYLDLVKDEQLRRLAESFWEHAPDYFFVIPASSTGKYHAPWSTSINGLFKHVIMGMYMANEFSKTFNLSKVESDIAITAMAGHDCVKYGIDYDVRYTDMHNFLPRSYYGNYKLGRDLSKLVLPEKWNAVIDAIERHMGPIADNTQTWRTPAKCQNRISPDTSIEYVVHLSDFVASRGKLMMLDSWTLEQEG